METVVSIDYEKLLDIILTYEDDLLLEQITFEFVRNYLNKNLTEIFNQDAMLTEEQEKINSVLFKDYHTEELDLNFRLTKNPGIIVSRDNVAVRFPIIIIGEE